MVCVSPLEAFQNLDRSETTLRPPDSGGLFFRAKLPCGKCVGCRSEQARAWALRCVHEASLHARNCFVTLTYNDAQLPSWGLEVSHFQKFCKKLRKRMGRFRFFHCGEYGEKSGRAHYHALLFGIDFLHDQVKIGQSNAGHPLCQSPTLDACWTDGEGVSRGFATVGSVTAQSAAYTARYTMKKLGTPETRLDPVTGAVFAKPYATMSRNPGIGAGWIDAWRSDVYPSDEVFLDGARFKPPRYYDERVGRTHSGQIEVVRANRRERVARSPASFSRASLQAKEREMNDRIAMYTGGDHGV